MPCAMMAPNLLIASSALSVIIFCSFSRWSFICKYSTVRMLFINFTMSQAWTIVNLGTTLFIVLNHDHWRGYHSTLSNVAFLGTQQRFNAGKRFLKADSHQNEIEKQNMTQTQQYKKNEQNLISSASACDSNGHCSTIPDWTVEMINQQIGVLNALLRITETNKRFLYLWCCLASSTTVWNWSHKIQ